MKTKSFFLVISFLIIALSSTAQKSGTFTDKRDGKIYKTVQIGKQTWMAENLAYEKAEGNRWAYDRNKSNVATYGYLYDWEAANTACPSGWHLPDEEEWTTLIDYLGGEDVAKDKLKSTKSWGKTSTGTDNSSGFAALPGGFQYYDEDSEVSFDAIGKEGYWWSSTRSSVKNNVIYLQLGETCLLSRLGYHVSSGLSVRCLKDK